MFKCRSCLSTLNTYNAYFEHCRGQHGEETVDCPICPVSNMKRRNFYLHMSKFHEPPSIFIQCLQCPQTVNQKKIRVHLLEHVRQSQCWICPFNAVHKFYTGYGHFYEDYNEHIASYHPGDEIPAVAGVLADGDQEMIDFDYGFDEVIEDTRSVEDICRSDYRHLLLKLEFEEFLPGRIVSYIANTLADLSIRTLENCRKTLEEVFPQAEPLDYDKVLDSLSLNNACCDISLSTSFRRKKSVQETDAYVSPMTVNIGPIPHCPKISKLVLFDVRELILRKLVEADWKPEENEGFHAEPAFVQTIKSKFEGKVYSSFRDSLRYKDILATVPEEERPPIVLLFYGDALDRDLMGHSSQKNKEHFTYFRILNLTDGNARSPTDFQLGQIVHDKAISDLTYNVAMAPLKANIQAAIEGGILWKGRKHAVRLSSFTGDGLERAQQTGMHSTFSRIAFFDPLSYLSTKTRKNCGSVDDLKNQSENLRTPESYSRDLRNVGKRNRINKANKGKQNKVKVLTDTHYTKGLKFHSLWNELPNFHVCLRGTIGHCLSHDIFAGAGRADMSLIAIALTKEGHFLWRDLQKKVLLATRKFLRGSDKVNWHSILGAYETFSQIPGNHACNHNFIRQFCFFFTDLPPDHEVSYFLEPYLFLKQFSLTQQI